MVRPRLRAWLFTILAAGLAALLLHTFVVQAFYVPTGSMEPTLMPGDRIVVSKLTLDMGPLHRGDIIVFHSLPRVVAACGNDTPVPYLVKRIIGLPGDRLSSSANTIYVDGLPLAQPWRHIEPLGIPIAPRAHPLVVPSNDYFVMGDNQPVSCDSRYWGLVPRSSVVGRAVWRIWIGRAHV